MCDYSLEHVSSRPAQIGDKLTSHKFVTGTRGFVDTDGTTAVCLLPGTEVAFSDQITILSPRLFGHSAKRLDATTAIFRHVNEDRAFAHHDALELPNGETILLTELWEGQVATVLQLPASPVVAKVADAPAEPAGQPERPSVTVD